MAVATIIIERNLEDFNQAIRDDILRKGINNTGNAALSLKVVSKGNKSASIGADYIEFLDKGRSPGNWDITQSPELDNIKEWVISKLGITQSPELDSVAYFVSRKIATEGTEIYKDRSKGVEIEKKVAVLGDKLRKDLAVFAVADIKKQLNKFKLQKQL